MKRIYDWLEVVWEFAAPRLPAAPASVLEIGCGRFGGLVPRLAEAGYQVTGVDPNAPDGQSYVQTTFEEYEVAQPVDAVVASVSLHHVTDLNAALDHLAATIRPGGTVVVAEWARERFDERTARWCFERLPEPETEDDHTWLHHHREAWPASGLSWAEYLDAWASEDGLLRADQVVAGLDARLGRVEFGPAPFLFAQIGGVPMADEQAAIDAGEIAAVGVRYVARR